jgi:hypothetical protein
MAPGAPSRRLLVVNHQEPVMNFRKIAAVAALAATAAGAAVAPGAAQAASPTTSAAYTVSVKPGALAGGRTSVRATVLVTNPQSDVRAWWSRSTVSSVVRKGVNDGYQEPYFSQGFRCVPTLDGSMNASTARFTCRLRGADVPTSVRITFTAPFAWQVGS